MNNQMKILETARQTLNLPATFDEIAVFSSFNDLIEGKSADHSLIDSKNILIREIIEKQLRPNPKKIYRIRVPFKSCKACKGTGENYRFEYKTEKENCKHCDENGVRVEMCTRCFGKGKRYSKKDKIMIRCFGCGGIGKYVFSKGKDRDKDIKCRVCRGKGYREKMVPTGRILNHTTCKVCEGTGKRPEEKFGTSVLSSEMAQVLKDSLLAE